MNRKLQQFCFGACSLLDVRLLPARRQVPDPDFALAPFSFAEHQVAMACNQVLAHYQAAKLGAR